MESTKPTQKITHKGWFGLCPVYFGGLDTLAPLVAPRHWVFKPLMVLSEICFYLVFRVVSFIDPDFQPMWPLKITGEFRMEANPRKWRSVEEQPTGYPYPVAPEGQIYVCSACGKTAKNIYTGTGGDRGWDASCALHSVLCYEGQDHE